jgi:type IV secretory pathway component VirB8
MFENQNELNSMEEKSDRIRSTAESFQMSATRLEKITRNRRWRAYIIIAAMLLSFFFVLYLMFRD